MAGSPFIQNNQIRVEHLVGDIRVIAERDLRLAQYLITEWGGETVYVPRRDVSVEHSVFLTEVSKVYGIEALAVLAECISGDVLYVPSPEPIFEAVEVADIKALYHAGVPVGALARMFKKARRTIRGIVIAKKKPEPVVDDRQLKLF